MLTEILVTKRIIIIIINNNDLEVAHPQSGFSSTSGGGAGSEVWNRVYMIAPVKKFGRVRLSTNFP